MFNASNQLYLAGLNLLGITNFLGTTNRFSYLNAAAHHSVNGIYYRQPIPYEVSISDSANNVVSRALLFPNFSPIMHLDLKKAMFVTRGAQISMANGFVTSYGVDKPSQIAGAAALPGELITSLTSGITNIVQLRLNIATGQSATSSAQLLNQSNLLQSISNQMVILNASQAYDAQNHPPPPRRQ